MSAQSLRTLLKLSAIHTDCLVSPTMGLSSCPNAPPIGLAEKEISTWRNLTNWGQRLAYGDQHCCGGSPFQVKPGF
jgi:hypothetical protein